MGSTGRLTRGRRVILVAVAALLVITGLAIASTRPTVINAEKVQYGPDTGVVLVDSHGHPLYVFTKDTNSASKCTGNCTLTFRPLPTSGKEAAKKGSGVNSKLFGTIKRGSKLQVTYNHHPVYVGTSDPSGYASEQNCKKFGGRWYVINTKGNPVKGRGCGHY